MKTERQRALVVLPIITLLIGATIIAQEVASPEGKKPQELWEDFLHYISIARPELAQSFGKAILEYPGIEPKQLYLLQRDTPRSSAVLARGSRLNGMKDIIADLRKLIEQGYQDLRSDPVEIAGAIEMLGGTMRGYEIAKERIKTSGEYALPQLLQKLMDPEISSILRERIIVLLRGMGKGAVRPLTAAIQSSDPKLQEVIANALGEIQYPHAVARLKELIKRKGVLERTKKAAERALIACTREGAMQKTVAALYYDQALDYYYQRESVAPDVRYPTANVWYWKEGRLTYKVVPREIFCDVYAMRMNRLALEHDENFYPAVSLWIAANLKRAADMPEGALDPTYGEETPSEKYFALASGAKYLQAALGRGLRDRNSEVAKGAIEALAKTSGAKNLIEPVAGGAQPLVEALGYPNREVRFLAAVSLANALPDRQFAGSELVAAQLIEALRQTGRKTALLIVTEQERNNKLKAALRAIDYEVIDHSDPTDAIAAAHKSPGVDVAVLSARPDPAAIIARFREDPSFVTLPVVVAGRTEKLRHLAEQDGRTVLIEGSADQKTIAGALLEAGKLTGGAEMTLEEAGQWAILVANAIRRLGETGNPIFRIARTEPSLIATLEDKREEVRLAASGTLAVMQSAKAQRAIAALALKRDVPEKTRIRAFEDLSGSLRRFGNQLTEELSQAVLDVVRGKGSPDLLNAAAQALGAMDLPSERIKSLILETSN